MGKRRACIMYQDRKYVRRRAMALLALLGAVGALGFALAFAGDRLAERACVTQLDNKSAWAVAYSKERGDYPF